MAIHATTKPNFFCRESLICKESSISGSAPMKNAHWAIPLVPLILALLPVIVCMGTLPFHQVYQSFRLAQWGTNLLLPKSPPPPVISSIVKVLLAPLLALPSSHTLDDVYSFIPPRLKSKDHSSTSTRSAWWVIHTINNTRYYQKEECKRIKLNLQKSTFSRILLG